MANTKIFTDDEIFDICKAYVLAADGNEYLDGEDILSMNNEELLDKIDTLSKTDKVKFMNQVEVSVKEQISLFNSTPASVMTEDDFEEHQTILSEVSDNWSRDFVDFIVD